MKQPLNSGKLTKTFLLNLPEGVYLASGVGETPGQPCFGETVCPLRERGAQWERIIKARVNNRSCDVFQNPADYMEYSLSIRYKRERN